MKLSQVSGFLAHDQVDGWDDVAQQWVENIGKGVFRVFDQFISDRNFGQTTRVLTVPGDGLDPKYLAVRIPHDSGYVRYFLEWQNRDVQGRGTTQTIYQLRECPWTCYVLTPETVTQGSGVERATGNFTPSRPFFCSKDYDTARNSPEFNGVSHTYYDIHLPPEAGIVSDSLLEINGVQYQVMSSAISLNLIEARAVARTAG